MDLVDTSSCLLGTWFIFQQWVRKRIAKLKHYFCLLLLPFPPTSMWDECLSFPFSWLLRLKASDNFRCVSFTREKKNFESLSLAWARGLRKEVKQDIENYVSKLDDLLGLYGRVPRTVTQKFPFSAAAAALEACIQEERGKVWLMQMSKKRITEW